MNNATLTVEQVPHGEGSFIVKLDGKEIPFVTNVSIISDYGSIPKLVITCVLPEKYAKFSLEAQNQ